MPVPPPENIVQPAHAVGVPFCAERGFNGSFFCPVAEVGAPGGQVVSVWDDLDEECDAGLSPHEAEQQRINARTCMITPAELNLHKEDRSARVERSHHPDWVPSNTNI
jgi:hypothetical protein